MAAVQMNLKKLWMVHVKGVGSPSSGLLVVEYFQLSGYEDVPFCEVASNFGVRAILVKREFCML